MVFSRPKRRAIAGAARKERAARRIVPKKIAQCVQIGFVADIEPIRDDALHDETTGEGIHGEDLAASLRPYGIVVR